MNASTSLGEGHYQYLKASGQKDDIEASLVVVIQPVFYEFHAQFGEMKRHAHDRIVRCVHDHDCTGSRSQCQSHSAGTHIVLVTLIFVGAQGDPFRQIERTTTGDSLFHLLELKQTIGPGARISLN